METQTSQQSRSIIPTSRIPIYRKTSAQSFGGSASIASRDAPLPVQLVTICRDVNGHYCHLALVERLVLPTTNSIPIPNIKPRNAPINGPSMPSGPLPSINGAIKITPTQNPRIIAGAVDLIDGIRQSRDTRNRIEERL